MKIMVVSPHPDDETLGAGGTLLRYRKEGNPIFWLNITDIKPEYGWDQGLVSRRQKQLEEVKNFYSFDGFYNLQFPAAKLKNIDEGELIRAVKRVFESVKPAWIIIPGRYDAHSDHRVVHDCCMACAKTFRAPYIERVTTMEIISETDYGFRHEKFEPNLFVDISDEIEGKLDAMKIYDTEIGKAPFPRSLENIRSLASVRGGACTRRYAEAFYIVKQTE